MAKKQTRRSISVSRATYERLRTYCETNGLSMSQFVEHRVGDFLGRTTKVSTVATAAAALIAPVVETTRPVVAMPSKPSAPPVKPTADQIFTF